MNTIIKGIAALSVLLVSTAALAQEFKTPLKVTKGQEFSYQIDMVMDITQSMAGQEIKVNNITKSTSKNQITNVTTEGNAEVSSSVWDITSTAKTPMMDTTITMKGKVGPTFNILVDKFGNVLKKEKTDTTNVIPGGEAFNMDNNLTNTGIFIEFPKKNLTVGEKWNVTKNDSVSVMGSKMGFNITTEYVLGKTEVVDGKSYQKITSKSTIEIGGKMNMQGMALVIEGTGVQSGTSFIFPDSKVLYQMKADIELDMNLAITGPQNMTIPMTQKISLTQKLK
jgi:hypothetical protein